jgi:hypothetical protein
MRVEPTGHWHVTAFTGRFHRALSPALDEKFLTMVFVRSWFSPGVA